MFEHLGHWPAIVVTGPQRSGTRIAASMIAADTQKRYWDEDDWKDFDNPFDHLATLVHQGGVIHAPTLSCACHKLGANERLLLVFMIRKLEDIQASEQRIQWDGAAAEREAYLAVHGDCIQAHDLGQLPVAALAQQIWALVQAPALGEQALTLEYEALEGHKLWVPKSERAQFAWNQCRRTDVHAEP